MTTETHTHPAALSHGALQEVLPDVFFVSGAMETLLMDSDWCFSRNMVVVREDGRLVLFNSVRLDAAGLAALDALGKVTAVVRLGALHGRDDAFYVSRYGAPYWQLPGLPLPEGIAAAEALGEAALPLRDASVFAFATSKLPEAIVRLDREGGVLLACDALQNWLAPDEFFSEQSRETMTQMGFFTPANIGPVWQQFAQPEAEDFARLKQWSFRHVLCGHGEPLLNQAEEQFHRTFQRVFGV